MTKKTIHINCDLGEGGAVDEHIMPLISSCNIACGGHYGNHQSIEKTLLLAKKHAVYIGAHPSYPDIANFGRTSLQMSTEALRKSLYSQLQLFFKAAEQHTISVHHVKPHGALYHDVAANPQLARLFVDVVQEFSEKIILYTACDWVVNQLDFPNKQIYVEAFADRRYNNDKKLVSRTISGSVLTHADEVSDQVLNLVLNQEVKTIEGDWIKLAFDTLCFHSDTPNALENLAYVHQKLNENNIQIIRDDT